MVKPYSGERTVNCALDFVNRMTSCILYLSLWWSYDVGSCTIAISVMTAIKWYLFCYRLDFNQKLLNYTTANAQSTVHWTLLTEWCLTSYISVYDGRMKLGIVPLRSVWWQLRWSYEVGSCTIAISVMTAIKWCLFYYRLDFNHKS